jgi:protein-tyrosine-phosphatase
MAQALAGAWLADHPDRDAEAIDVASAGLVAYPGQAASPGAAQAMAACGLSLADHRAVPLTPDTAQGADLILAMTEGHARAVRRLAPGARVESLCAYAGAPGEVADPYGGDAAVYAACARQLADLTARAMERLRAEGQR